MAVPFDLLPHLAVGLDKSGSTAQGKAALMRRKGTQTIAPLLETLLFPNDVVGVPHAQWTKRLPDDYGSGGTLKILWFANVTSGNVKWQARVAAITPADVDTPLEHAFAAAATVTTSVNTTEAKRLVESSITLTMDSAAAGDLIIFDVFRDPTDAADTAAGDAELVVATFSYT